MAGILMVAFLMAAILMASFLMVAFPVQARHDGQNYVFSLLTGYREPPAGVHVSRHLVHCF